MKKSPFKGADTSLISAVGSAEAETSEAGGKIIEAIYESEEDCIDEEGNDESVKKNYNFFGMEWES